MWIWKRALYPSLHLDHMGFGCWLAGLVGLFGFGLTGVAISLFIACALSLLGHCLVKKPKR